MSAWVIAKGKSGMCILIDCNVPPNFPMCDSLPFFSSMKTFLSSIDSIVVSSEDSRVRFMDLNLSLMTWIKSDLNLLL